MGDQKSLQAKIKRRREIQFSALEAILINLKRVGGENIERR